MLPLQLLSDTSISYIPRFKRRNYFIYWTILLLVMAVIAALPLVHTTVSVKTTGITRPVSERTEIKPAVSGIIDGVYYTEGQSVPSGATIVRIKDYTTKGKTTLNNYEMGQRAAFIHDLQLLTSRPLEESLLASLQSPLYREQLSHYLNQHTDQDAALRKANQELAMNTQLMDGKVISKKEFFDVQIAQQRAEAGYKAFEREQLTTWQQQLAQYRLELSQYRQSQEQVVADARFYEVRAPVAGIVQGINNRYAGGVVQAGETLCTVSPESGLIAECYVSPADIGLVRVGQPVRFQVDAFDYNYFGIVTGRVAKIDDDYTATSGEGGGSTPVFKVRCRFDTTQLHLKNGFNGRLKKGMTFQSRFVIGERTLWQLLWDKVDDWLNPAAPK
ncbi:MAG: HlyD family efflux transporter periplasmic adaptor subunit [Chitinophagaceae bacterium]